MKEIIVFGKNYPITEQQSNKDEIELKEKEILIKSHKTPPNALLKELLTNLLHTQLVQTYNQIKKEEKIEILGNLDFEIVEKIDNKKQRIAKIYENKILMKLNAVSLPKTTLKYIIAHELAHTFTKRHTKRFWKIMEAMCPNFQKEIKLLNEYKKSLCNPPIK